VTITLNMPPKRHKNAVPYWEMKVRLVMIEGRQIRGPRVGLLGGNGSDLIDASGSFDVRRCCVFRAQQADSRSSNLQGDCSAERCGCRVPSMTASTRVAFSWSDPSVQRPDGPRRVRPAWVGSYQRPKKKKKPGGFFLGAVNLAGWGLIFQRQSRSGFFRGRNLPNDRPGKGSYPARHQGSPAAPRLRKAARSVERLVSGRKSAKLGQIMRKSGPKVGFW